MCIYYLTQAWIQPNYLLLSAPEESQTITHVASFISDAVSMINERRKKRKSSIVAAAGGTNSTHTPSAG